MYKRILIASAVANVVAIAYVLSEQQFRDLGGRRQLEASYQSGLVSQRRGATEQSASIREKAQIISGDAAAIAARMKADGFPKTVLELTVVQAVQEEYNDEIRMWSNVQADKKDEAMTRLAEINELVRDRVMEILGIDILNGKYDKIRHAIRYSGFPENIVPSIVAIEKAPGLTDDDRLNKIRELVTEEEFERYKTFNSKMAGELQDVLAAVEIDEDSYKRVFKIRENLGVSRLNQDGLIKMVAPLSESLSGSDFLAILPRLDPLVASGDSVFMQAGMTEASRVAIAVGLSNVVAALRVARRDKVDVGDLKRSITELVMSNEHMKDTEVREKFLRSPIGRYISQ